MKHIKKSQGFTLIELLVVISIISLLSSVVLASVNIARDKGEVAAGLKFGGYNFRTLGANSLVSYDFNDTSITVTDSSGNGYDIILYGCNLAPFCRSPLSPTNTGSSLLLGATQYGVFEGPISLAGATGATLSAWIYPTAIDSVNGEPIAVFGSEAVSDFSLGISRNSLLTASMGNYSLEAPSAGRIALNKWQHVTAVFVDSLRLRLYLNGRFVGEMNMPVPLPTSTMGLDLGKSGINNYFNGNIDDFAMYKESLTATEVFNIYAQGIMERAMAHK